MASTAFRPTTLDDSLWRVAIELRSLARCPNVGDATWKRAKAAIVSCAGVMRVNAGQLRAPIDLAPMLSLRRITREFYLESQDTPEAFLTPTPEGFSIGIRPGQSFRRERFSKAHELAHTFFYDLTTMPPRKLVRTDDPLAYRKMEDICNAFASELLLPEAMVANSLDRLNGRSYAEAVQTLSSEYAVSAEVVIRDLLMKHKTFAATVAIVSSGHGSQIEFRRWYGGAIKKPRVSESRFLSTVLNAATKEPTRLSEICDASKGLAAVSWSMGADMRVRPGDYMLVDFRPHRRT